MTVYDATLNITEDFLAFYLSNLKFDMKKNQMILSLNQLRIIGILLTRLKFV